MYFYYTYLQIVYNYTGKVNLNDNWSLKVFYHRFNDKIVVYIVKIIIKINYFD